MPHLWNSAGHGPEEVNGHHLVTVLVGRLLEGQTHIIRSVDRIDHSLVERDRRMDRNNETIARQNETIARQDERLSILERCSQQRQPQQDGVTRVERLIARWLAYLIPAAALLATGSWDTATKLLSTLK